jgi:hypothetical protein
MQISLSPPVIVSTDAGDVTCTVGAVSVAASASANVRVVPLGPDGTAYPARSISVVGRPGTADVDAFLAAVQGAAATLVGGRR